MAPRLSVVVPVFNCAECLGPLHERIQAVMASLQLDYQIVLVDDRSGDCSWGILKEIATRDHRVDAVRLSRNFGQHAAITAGLARASGDWTVVMDCDLQDPPEVIPELLATARQGYEIVFGRRRRKGHSLMRRIASTAYFKVTNALLDTDIDGEFGTFSILSRKVVNAFLQIRDKDRQYLHILFWLGYKHTAIEFEHQPRFAGQSSYSFKRLLRHGFEGVFFQTTTLLRWIVYFGFLVALAGVALAAYLVLAYLSTTRPPEGWTSLAVLVLLVGGFIIVSTGVTGLYIGMIFKQVKDRPLYIIDEVARDARS
jgi:dolichol-phosphate mannosyltransferase